MSTIARPHQQSVAFELLSRLMAGMDPVSTDNFIDDLLTLAANLNHVRCGFVDDSSLRLDLGDGIFCEAAIPRAKTKLRMVCARLASRCANWSNRLVSPYGDIVDFNAPGHQQGFKVSFENTSDAQWFLVEAHTAR